jgi:hypothetical protein
MDFPGAVIERKKDLLKNDTGYLPPKECMNSKHFDRIGLPARLAVLASVFALTFSMGAQYVGVTCGYQYSAQLTGPPTYPNQLNISMYNPNGGSKYDTNNQTWDTWVEQLQQAGVDFVCPNCTGSWPNTNNPPTMIAPMVAAVNRRGLASQLQFAIFDDNAASWTAQYNLSIGNGYGYTTPMDLANPNNWKFLYDYNYKLFYQTVPDANRFKINGRPVIIFWSTGTTYITNIQGNLSRALLYVRQKCQADFGFNPYIVAGSSAITRDTTCTNAGVLDALQGWFTAGPSGPAYTMRSYSGVSVGVGVAEFQHPGQSGFLDPNHGQLFESNLANTVGAGALLTLLEGFTDYEEDAAMWRARNLDANGNVLSYSQTLYDYPNQRIGILRKHSRNPFPSSLLFEAEGCDYFGGANGGNGKVNFYRNGNIAIETTTDTSGGWDVSWIQSGEWFEWEQVPLNGTPHFLVRMASSNTGRTGHFVIDVVAQASQTLPNTGGSQNWVTYDFGSYGTYANSYHTVRFVSDNGGISFNWWEVFSGVSNGVYKIVNRNSGLALDAKGQATTNGTPVQQYAYSGGNNQRWAVTNLGSSYKIVGVQSGLSLDVKGQSTANGAALQLYSYGGGANQQWIITSTSGGYSAIKGVQSGKLVEALGGGTTNGTPVDQWSSTGGNNQQWILEAP